MTKKYAWTCSGGAVMFAGMIASARVTVESGYIPDVMAGVSSGAMVLPLIAVAIEIPELWDITQKVANEVQPKDYFPGWDDMPVGPKGNLTIHAIGRIATGHPNLGEQDIRDLYKSVFTEEYFEVFKHSEIDCYAYGVDYDLGKLVEYHLNSATSLDDLIDMLQASNRIPIFTQAKDYNGVRHFDGGMKTHNPGQFIMKKHPELEQHISVFARTGFTDIEKFFTDEMGFDNKWDNNLIAVVDRTIRVTTHQISLNDQELQMLYAEKYNIKYKPIFLPATMLDEMYDNDTEEVTAFAEESTKITIKEMKNFLS
jgi:predicted acylesterase/phospholipase RssA